LLLPPSLDVAAAAEANAAALPGPDMARSNDDPAISYRQISFPLFFTEKKPPGSRGYVHRHSRLTALQLC